MKAADEHGLTENVTVDGFEHVRPSDVRPEIQLRIEREELERVVVMRTSRGRAGSHVADSPAQVLGLH